MTIRNSSPFTDSISKINNNQIGNIKDLHVVMLCENHVKTSGSLRRLHKDGPNHNITDPGLFILKEKKV